jgi:hypothetical protein
MLIWVCGFQNNMPRYHKICFQHSQCVVLKQHVGLYVWSRNYMAKGMLWIGRTGISHPA